MSDMPVDVNDILMQEMPSTEPCIIRPGVGAHASLALCVSQAARDTERLAKAGLDIFRKSTFVFPFSLKLQADASAAVVDSQLF